MTIVLSISAVVAIATTLLACRSGKKNIEGNSNNEQAIWAETPIPKAFEHYKTLNSKYEDEKYETILFVESHDYMAPSPIRMYWTINDQAVVCVTRDFKEPEPGYHYYKLDVSGNVLHTLYVPYTGDRKVGLIGPYALHISSKEDYFYTTWPLNGDTTRQSIEILNRDLSWSADKLAQTYEAILRTGKYAFNEPVGQLGNGEPDFSLNRIFFFEDGKYKVLYKKMKGHASVPDFKKLYRAEDEFYNASDDQSLKFIQNFQLKHFQQVEKLSYEHSIGGGSPSFSAKGWAGRAFFDLPLNKDTLKVRYDEIIVETATSGDDQTRYYRSNGNGSSVSPLNINLFTDPRLNYAVYSVNARQLYLIKPKKNVKLR